MNTASTNSCFPVRSAVATFSVAALAAWALCEAVLPSLMEVSSGFSAAVGVAVFAAWLGAVAGLAPVVILSKSEGNAATLGFLYGAAARMIVGLIVFMIAGIGFELPKDVLAVALMIAYIVLLVVDVIFVCRYLSALPKAPVPTGPVTGQQR